LKNRGQKIKLKTTGTKKVFNPKNKLKQAQKTKNQPKLFSKSFKIGLNKSPNKTKRLKYNQYLICG
jgi:hypothetical protein